MGGRGFLTIIINQTDVSSSEWTSDAKSGLTVFVVREMVYSGSQQPL